MTPSCRLREHHDVWDAPTIQRLVNFAADIIEHEAHAGLLDVLPSFRSTSLLDVHRDHLYWEAGGVAAFGPVKLLHVLLQIARYFPARHTPICKKIENHDTTGKVIQFYQFLASKPVEFKLREHHLRCGMRSNHTKNQTKQYSERITKQPHGNYLQEVQPAA